MELLCYARDEVTLIRICLNFSSYILYHRIMQELIGITPIENFLVDLNMNENISEGKIFIKED